MHKHILRGYKLITYFVTTLSLTVLFLARYASAVSCSATEKTGATQDVCDRASCPSNCTRRKKDGTIETGIKCSYQYGAIFFTGGWDDENSWPTWDGSSSLDFSVRGQAFCCVSVADGYVTANDISIKYGDTKIALSGTSLGRSCGGSNDSWGPRSSDRLKATVSANVLNAATCNNGTCKLTVDATSRMGTSKTHTYNSYIIFKKQEIKNATFEHEAITASSTEMSKSGDYFTGDGKSTSYKITVTYKIKRTNNTPESATSKYAYNDSTANNDNKYPTDNATKTSTGGLKKDNVKSIPVVYTISVPNGATNQRHCFYLRYDSSVPYEDSTRKDGNFAGKVKKCFYFTNPAKNDAHFTGSISASGSNLTVSTLDANSKGTVTGNGLGNSFSLTPTYTITRSATDGDPASASSDYAYRASTTDNDNQYPGNSATKSNTGGLAKGAKKDDTPTSSVYDPSFTLNIDAAAITKCFYLRYDTAVTYYDTTRDDSSANFAGLTHACYSITNPHQEYTATFGGENHASSSGTIDAHDQLTRSSNNTVGVIDHATRTTGENSYDNGRFNEDTYPSNSQYTATFTHTVSRTDSAPSNTATSPYASSAKTSWKVQYSLNGGDWTDYAQSDDKDGSSATVSGEDNLTGTNTKTITVHPKWTLDASNKGEYIYYCQRLKYKASSTYKTATPSDNSNSYTTVFVSYGNDAYTSGACITLRNPLWEETQTGELQQHDIHVSGTTGDINPSGAQLINATDTTKYETTALISSFAFDHTLTRTDSGFNEAQIGASSFDSSVTYAFFHPSIHNNCNYAVTTKMWGNERMPGTHTHMDLIYAQRDSEGTACNGTTKLNSGANGGLVNGYEVQLTSPSRPSASNPNANQTSTWSSSSTGGRTSTCFHATIDGFPTSGYPCRSDRSTTNGSTIIEASDAPSSNYLLLAGQTKQFSQSTYDTRSDWYVRYKNIVRCETYTSGYFIGSYPTKNLANDCKYDRTEVADMSPVLKTTPVYADSTYTTYSLFRPYNYQITLAQPQEEVPSAIAYAGQNVGNTFNITVNRKDNNKSYITDPLSPNVYVIGYRIPANYNSEDPARTKITNATVGAAGVTNTGNAQTDLCTNFYGTADRLGFGADANHCQVLSGHPAKLPANGENNTDYNRVYGDSRYILSYTTSDIYVPDNLGLGEKYCVAIAIANYSADLSNPGTNSNYGFADSRYFISSSTCSNIAKLPSVNVWSGSVKTNGGIKTSVTATRQTDGSYLTYGSWADFAVIANGHIAKMASAASIAQGFTGTGNLLCGTDHLTIANSQCSGANSSTVTALGNSKVIAESTTLAKLKARYVDGNSSSILLQQSTLTATDFAAIGLNPNSFLSTTPLVVYSSSDLTISTNIQLDNAHVFTQNSTPQVILIANGNVNIDQSVTHLDAWIVAGSTIDTCTDGASSISLHANVCTDQLIIRGALLGSKINFKRTHGGDANQGTANTPAEIIKYDPGILLFTAKQSEHALLPETTYLHKLPARY